MQLLERSIHRFHGFAVVVLFAVTAAFALAPRAPEHRCTCGHRQKLADPRAVADAQYHDKQFDAAAATLQEAALSGRFDRELASELLVVAAFYEQLGREYALALDPETPLQQALVALRWATQLDAMLGGAHADTLAHVLVNP